MADRRVIALWAVPRSVSTALEKCFSQRSDTEVVHEPFTDCYYFSARRRSHRYGDQAHKHDYGVPDVLAQIDAADGPLVVVKDLCFQAEPYVPGDLLNAAANVFVLRRPQAVWRSLLPLKPDFTEDEFGFTALERMWRQVVDELGHPPVVVDGDLLRDRPEETLRELCDRLDIGFQAQMLHWRDGAIRRWSDDERESQRKWHSTLEHSTGILPPGPPTPVDVPPDREPIVQRASQIYTEIMAVR